jgi:hypothetical protein
VEDDTGSCAVRDILPDGSRVYGVSVCTKDRVASSQIVSIDLGSGARTLVDSVAGEISGLTMDDGWIYYGVVPLASKSGEIRRASRTTGGHATFVPDVPAGATGPATSGALDEVYYGAGSRVFAAPKDGSTPHVVATIGSLSQTAAIVVQQIAVSPDGVFARVGELEGRGDTKSHVVALE